MNTRQEFEKDYTESRDITAIRYWLYYAEWLEEKYEARETEINNYKQDIRDREQLRKETMRMLNIKEEEIKQLRDEVAELTELHNDKVKYIDTRLKHHIKYEENLSARNIKLRDALETISTISHMKTITSVRYAIETAKEALKESK